MTKKMLRILLKGSLFIIVFAIVVWLYVGIKMYYLRNHGFTKYDLTYQETCVLYSTLSIYMQNPFNDDNIFAAYELYHHPKNEASYYVYDARKVWFILEADGKTEEEVKKLNEELFSLPNNNTARRLAEEYGFNENNPLSVDWVLQHPKKTCQIIIIMNYNYARRCLDYANW